ncbi:hypothetical protein HMPREF0647_08140 [Prevotella bivia DNF00320]|uniref:Lipoprotein n=1 Tax=Prevotella bivia DNF00320 TaxID=1401068 RepID=A0A096CFP2_9BACT|nr:DUF4840 domain-containing protein [Prevotella bivia]KGF44084.1 hypothetical protein HMPREF0647_08140 [Prevotella bivia DNF00320]
MKSKIKTLALILIGATTAFTVSSCLGDSTDNYEERNAFVNKAMTSSLGNWSGKLIFSNTLKVKEEEPAVTWNTSKDKDSYKITISNFPVNKLAKSIKVPEVTATSSNELKLAHDSLTALKDALAASPNVTYTAAVGTLWRYVKDPLWYFMPMLNIDLTLKFMDKEHHYKLMQYKNNEELDAYVDAFASVYQTTPESMKINGLFRYLVEVDDKGRPSKEVREFSPSQFFFTSTSHTK